MSAQITPAPVRRSVTVRTSAAHAFQVFTADIGRWWPSTHHVGDAPLKAAVLEPRVGGRWYEIGEDGTECDWGRVLAWEPPTRVVLAWQLTDQFRFDPDFETEVEVRFIPEAADRTRVELEHRLLERYGEAAQGMADRFGAPGGWGGLLALFMQAAEA